MEKKWDEVYEQTHNQEVMQPQEVAVVAEKEYEYGADAFEAYMESQNGKEANFVEREKNIHTEHKR